MEFLTPELIGALLSIILIDLTLGGDNAIVIGMVARTVPVPQQKKVILLGAAGAFIVRSLTTIIAVELLKVPGLLLAGGIFLLRMAYNLLNESEGDNNIKCSTGILGAVQTIIIADTIMGFDNVLAVAGAAHGNYSLVIFGLMFSIPIVVWGSTLVIKAIKYFPVIIDLGAIVITLTAARMIMEEPFLARYFTNSWIHTGVMAFLITVMLASKKVAILR
ncbi:MAG TPA: TerC family protein [Desulfitobacteriaceae bacterium]|jgi:YjbE family integral membrane protein|nr:TerC family protein [Desulfitobacteriaceae bacterium]